jgi:hypothetical protein
MEEGEEAVVVEEEMDSICIRAAAKKECTILRNALAA